MIKRALILLLLFVATPAPAAPRDDVQAAMARCAVFADDHQYLDCLYGAAQPLRAELGLPPAPASQIRLVPLSARPAAPQPPTARPAPRSGFLGSLLGTNNSAGLRIASYTFAKHGMFTVTLSDGEVWQQTGNDIHYAHWRGAPPKGAVTVTEGAFGGAHLDLDGEPIPIW